MTGLEIPLVASAMSQRSLSIHSGSGTTGVTSKSKSPALAAAVDTMMYISSPSSTQVSSISSPSASHTLIVPSYWVGVLAQSPSKSYTPIINSDPSPVSVSPTVSPLVPAGTVYR